MIAFSPLDVNKSARLKEYFERTPYGISEYSVAILFMWNSNLSSKVAFVDGCAFLSIKHEDKCEFLLPAGVSLQEGMKLFKEHVPACSDEITFICIPSTHLDELKALFPDADFVYKRKWSDYIYNAEDIKALAGRKYGGQRNHINRFLKENPEPVIHHIDEGNIDRVIDFLHEFVKKDTRQKPESFFEEYEASLLVLNNFFTLGQCGIFVTVDDKIISFAVGEVVADTLFVHIEKADLNYHGSYPFIVRSFAREFAVGEVKFINREDDVDDPGLRASKMSYHPERIVDKYYCTVKL